MDSNDFRKKILTWYDQNRRALPWRAGPGQKPDPYHVWLSEIMLQQTTVPAVIPYFLKFLNRFPTIHDLAGAEKEDIMALWAGLGYYARARNLHRCAQSISSEHEGVFPDDIKSLKALPGIGDYTAAAIRSIAFDQPATVMDGNIERVMARVFVVQEPLPAAKKTLKSLAHSLSHERTDRPGDYAQALMDLGAMICTPQSPKCALCPVQTLCQAREQGIAADLPARETKKAKPLKTGILYWVENTKGEILCERRPEDVMMGGMLGLPTSPWKIAKKVPSVKSDSHIRHSFTHFDLILQIKKTDLTRHEKGMILPENNLIWIALSKIEDSGLPSLFQKAVKLMK